MTPEGLRIELMERDSSLFFRVGSATVIEPMKTILEKVYDAVALLPNPITVEGHTDSRQYAQWHNYSNWELSTDRANSARRILEAAGMRPGRIDRVVGHADLLLRFPDDPLNAGNRRISILVRKTGHG
jgi:chemotaxis protein MotB